MLTQQVLPGLGLVAFEGHLGLPGLWGGQLHTFACTLLLPHTRQVALVELLRCQWVPVQFAHHVVGLCRHYHLLILCVFVLFCCVFVVFVFGLLYALHQYIKCLSFLFVPTNVSMGMLFLLLSVHMHKSVCVCVCVCVRERESNYKMRVEREWTISAL